MISNLKATGVVRKIDSLGRVVIPKEIRNTLHMKKGDSIEVYTNSREELVFKKYSAVSEILTYIEITASVLSRTLEMPIMISGQEKILAIAGAPKEYLEKKLSTEVDTILKSKRSYSFTNEEKEMLHPIEGMDNVAYMVFPIISMSDVVGMIIVLMPNETPKINFKKAEGNERLIKTAAEILGKQIEN